MHLAYAYLFPEKAGQPYLKRKRLKANNAFDLPAGEYLIYDLYPMSPLEGPDLYFMVERVKTSEILLTARFAYPEDEDPELSISRFHLQSPQAAEALALLHDVIDTPEMGDLLEARAFEVMAQTMQQMSEQLAEDPEAVDDFLKVAQEMDPEHAPRNKEELFEMLSSTFGITVEELPGGDEIPDDSKIVPIQSARSHKQHKATSSQSTVPKKTPPPQGSLVLRVDLMDTPLKIWRRIQVPASLSLTDLHTVLQVAMGWEDSHLWQFTDQQGRSYSFSEGEGWMQDLDPQSYCIGDLLKQEKDYLDYLYDFGDSWDHRLKLEKRLPESLSPQVLKGKNACPPEDCGGVWGYAELLQVLAKKRKTAEEQELLENLPEGFNPEQFEPTLANETLRELFAEEGNG